MYLASSRYFAVVDEVLGRVTQCEAPCRPKLENSEEILTAPGLAFALAIETRRRVGAWTRHGTGEKGTDGPWILG